MSGGAYEYVMGGMYTSDKTKIIIEDSEFSDEELTIGDDAFLGHKYINIYNYWEDDYYGSRKLGDATGETQGW